MQPDPFVDCKKFCTYAASCVNPGNGSYYFQMASCLQSESRQKLAALLAPGCCSYSGRTVAHKVLLVNILMIILDTLQHQGQSIISLKISYFRTTQRTPTASGNGCYGLPRIRGYGCHWYWSWDLRGLHSCHQHHHL